jgi:ribonuclease HI
MRVFTDGACSGNPGPGGWAWVTDDGRHDSGGEPETTNQRMELTAVLEAVKGLSGPLAIHSDSTYVVNCFNDRWYEGWRARGWKNAQRKPVANRDLWEPLIELYLARAGEVTFTWVKGHAGHELNELADQMAVAEIDRLRQTLPADALTSPVDAAPSTGAPTGAAVPWPADQAIVITGARELDDEQLGELEATLDSLDRDNDVVVSGLRLGAELSGAELALRRQIPLAVVLPYPDPVRVWGAADRARFDQALEAATWVVVLDGDPSRPAPAIKARNQWLWSVAVGAVVAGDEALATEAETAGLGVIALS